MPKLQVFCDAHLGESNLQLLRDGIAPHKLVQPANKGASVLAIAPTNPALFEADVALGQPDVAGVLKAGKLRWLQVTSAGFTRYDTAEFRAAAKARGLVFTNSSSVYAEACAEHVFSFMMAQARHLPTALHTRCANGTPEWNAVRSASTCLLGQSAVILGYGAIAARLVEMLAPFRMKITALRRQPRGDEGIPIVTEKTLAGALATADHVISILPDNAESVGFISLARLAQMKPGAVFYNIGRGTTVDQKALDASLRSGRLAAAWLDVSDPEPLPEGHPLLSAPNCHLTPHTAGGHPNENETLARHFLQNFKRFVANEPLRDRVM
jgi:phosphoglycerate dehydrogenase-like enzyme